MSDPRSMQTPSEAQPMASTGRSAVTAHEAVVRGAVYRLLAQGFREPNGGWLETFIDAGQDLMDARFSEGLRDPNDSKLVAAIEQLLDSFPESDSIPEIRGLHDRLFGHTAAGDCPLYETEYGVWGAFQQPHVLADLAGTYRAFGLVLSNTTHERADHLSLQCEFLYVLAHKESWAYQHDGPAEVAICVDARRLFLENHLARWAPSVGSRLKLHAPGSLYSCIGEILVALTTNECRTLDIQIGGELPLRSTSSAAEDLCAGCTDPASPIEAPNKGTDE